MGAKKLGDDAFEYYVGLGPARTFVAVARKYGVDKRTVSRLATKEKWADRVSDVDREVRARTEAHAASALEAQQLKSLSRIGEFQDAIHDVITPQRLKALFAGLLNAAVKEGDVGAARLIIERVLGKPRNESLSPTSLDLPDGLETASDVRTAANAILQAVSEGSLAPEDAQKAAVVLESARRSVETEELERRVEEIEVRLKEEKLT